MVCSRSKFLVLAAAVTLVSGVAQAADYSPPQPCYDAALIASGRAPYGAVPCYVPPRPVVVEEFSGWYLRGDIGVTNQSVKNLENALPVTSSTDVGFGFDASPLFGLGVGYYFNDWLRFDLTGEYRSKANFHGTQIVTSGGNTYTDEYSGSKSEWLFLLNAYVDLGTWNGFTPFVGAGVGGSRNTIHSFQDVCSVGCGAGSVAFGDTASKWNFAWALHAGVAYKVSKNFTVEFAYRYVDLGDATSGDLYAYDGTNAVYNPMEFKHLTSHDFKLGLRFNLDAFDSYSQPVHYYAPPVYAPPPVYSQPPVYMQPPLHSKG